ncbi:MAG: glycoside hydrolase family 16 protein [Bacteroidia bacterium]
MKLMFNIPTFRFFTLVSLPLLTFSLTSCKVDETQQLEARSWALTWSDEFDGPAGQSPNTDNWAYDIGTGDNGWGNGEFQYYTDRKENVSLDGEGHLVLTARRETFAGANFTSARITTKGSFSQAYGRFEANIKTPYGPGLWPAFWMLGEDIDEVGWPQCGEIDIMEMRGQQPYIVHGTVHGPGYSAGAAITSSYSLENSRFDTDFHLYAVEWYPDRIDFFVDDFLYKRITPEDVTGEWVYDQPFFLILNVAVGGTFVGFPTSQTPFPQTMVVDYVKVYK